MQKNAPELGYWENIEQNKLNKSGRKWVSGEKRLSYEYIELFCEKCGKSLGLFSIVDTNLETNMYCDNCVKQYIRECPISLPCGTVLKDCGHSVIVRYDNNYYAGLEVEKICYFNKKGRYIKVKGKRYYI